jgi:hypothetical protein
MGVRAGFEATVSAVVYAVIAERFGARGWDDDDFPNNRVVAFVLGQHARAAAYLRWPLAAVTVAFDWSTLPTHGRRFHRMGSEARARVLGAWRRSRLSVCRDFVRFYESLTVYSWFAESEPRRQAGSGADTARRTAA